MSERICDGYRYLMRCEPTDEIYTWWSNRSKTARDKNVGWRIDYQLVCPMARHSMPTQIMNLEYLTTPLWSLNTTWHFSKPDRIVSKASMKFRCAQGRIEPALPDGKQTLSLSCLQSHHSGRSFNVHTLYLSYYSVHVHSATRLRTVCRI